MRANLRDGLTAAIRSRDRVAVAALRSALAAIDNAEARPGDRPAAGVTDSEHVAGAAVGVGAADAERRALTAADVRSIVEQEVHDRSTAAGEYEQLGRDEVAERLRSEAGVLSAYLDTAS